MRFLVPHRAAFGAALVIGAMIATLAHADPVAAQAATVPPTTASVTQRTISVTGTSTVTLAPDLAMFSAGVTETNADVNAAQNTVNTKTNAIIDALRQGGVDVMKDVVTAGYSVQPQYDYPQNGSPMLTGYRVTNNVNVTVRDITKVGQLLNAVTQAGANQVGGVSFSLADPEAASNMARTQAIQNARARADVLASASNVSVGGVLTIDDQTTVQMPPRPIAVATSGSAANAAAAPPPIQTGETSVTATVRVTYLIA